MYYENRHSHKLIFRTSFTLRICMDQKYIFDYIKYNRLVFVFNSK